MAGHRKSDPEPKSAEREESEKLDDQLEDTFPASDPPASTAPGHGETGALDIRKSKIDTTKR